MAAKALLKTVVPLSLRLTSRHTHRRINSQICSRKLIGHHYSTEGQIDPNQRLQITENCVKQLNKVCESGEALRVYVEGGGCSGFQYKFEFDKEVSDDDKIFEKEGAKVVIDKDSLQFLNGASIEYTTELIRSGFLVVNNPNAGQGCSCGVSFTVKI